jgi:hypothetical protein
MWWAITHPRTSVASQRAPSKIFGNTVRSEDRCSTVSINISGHGNVVGNNSSSYVSITASPELLTALNNFISRLASYDNDIGDGSVRADAEAARAEMTKPAPKWDRVRALLGRVATGVAGITALTSLVNNILDMLPHL